LSFEQGKKLRTALDGRFFGASRFDKSWGSQNRRPEGRRFCRECYFCSLILFHLTGRVWPAPLLGAADGDGIERGPGELGRDADCPFLAFPAGDDDAEDDRDEMGAAIGAE
jgi:hypothetical protein